MKEVEGLKWEEEENGESWKTEWQKLRKLIIETEGSAAPREIDAKEGSGSLGITGNYPLHQRLLSLAFPQNRRVYQCPSVLPQAPLRPLRLLATYKDKPEADHGRSYDERVLPVSVNHTLVFQPCMSLMW